MLKVKLIVFLSLLFAINYVQAAELYVSPAGRDTNSGAKSEPLASFAAAQAKARSLASQEAVTVHVADGVYYLPETIVFTAADSGTTDYPVVYKATNECGAVLSGGSELTLDWKPYRDGIFMATTAAGLQIDQLFVDGKNQRMARYPNYDASKTAEPYQGFAADAFAKKRAANWDDPTGGYIHAMHRSRWGGYHYRITGKDAQGEVAYEGGWQNNRQMGMHADFRMVENVFEELDAPGEWFHDAAAQTLYYLPPSGVDLADAVVEVVRLRHLIEFQGSEADPVKQVTLQGFVFRHAARTFMDTKEPMLRSDWAIYRGGAVFLTGTEDVQILDSEFDQVGGNAIFVNKYNRRVLVKGCHIHDTGASGVCFVGDPHAVRDPLFEYGQKNDLAKIDRTPGPKTNNYPADSIVEDCLIHGIGRVERQPAGVQIEMSARISVRDCSIYDTARAGINIGDGAWGGHLIAGCDVFDTVQETHDHGSFNSWGRDRYWHSDRSASQSVVDENPALPFLDAVETTVIRNSRWRCDHGWDIDLDDGSSNYDIYNNLLLAGGLKLREGFRRRAWNNITVNNGLHPHVWYNHSEDEVFGNIFMAPARGARMPSDIAKGKRVDGNLYFNVSEDQMKRHAEFGWEVNSIAADPLFVDPGSGDFRVREGSPAFDIGFKNFPMDQFGVKKPALKSLAKTPVIPALDDESKSRGRSAGAPTGPPRKPMVSMWLGATLHSLVGEEFSAYGTRQEDGGVALTVVPSTSAAAKAGLQENDLIQSVHGKKVSDVAQFFKALTGIRETTVTLKLIRNQQSVELSVEVLSVVEVETATAADGFAKLPVPAASGRTVTANQSTGNDAIETLVDGQLGQSYGPVFANGIQNGAYKMDLGSIQSVAAITSWSFHMSDTRGAQNVTLYGSKSVTDPGWDLSAFTQLGTIDTGTANAVYTAVSLRAVDGQSLGQFRWIVWAVSPVSPRGGGENTALQELAVEAHATQANEFPGEKTDFNGFERYVVSTEEGDISVVCPQQAAPGKPWLWRSMFWGNKSAAVDRFTAGDLQLLEKGYHVVIAPGDVSGHPAGNAKIDAAYQTLTQEYGFSKTLSMASMSRETLALFRWASANPDSVESIYVDNGVCNVKSWPGGKLVPGSDSKGSGNAKSWELFKKSYGFASDDEALASKESPIDLLEPLAQAGVPILMGCGTQDDTVPYAENGAIMKDRYEQLGGSIRIITEDKGHHPHGLADMTPVVEFVLQNTPTPSTRNEKE